MSKKNSDAICLACNRCHAKSTVVIPKKDFDAKLKENARSATGVPIAGAVVGAFAFPLWELLSLAVASAGLVTSYLQLQAAKKTGEEFVVLCKKCGHWEKI